MTLFSADFMYVQTENGNRYVHGIIDIFTHQIVSLKYSKTMTANDVLNSLKELPKSIKVINIDYGTQYFEKNVQDFLILMSLSIDVVNKVNLLIIVEFKDFEREYM